MAEKKKKSKSIVIVILLLVLAIAGFGGYYLFHKLVFYHIDLKYQFELTNTISRRLAEDIKELNSINAKLAEAEKLKSETEEQIARGSLGFFESIGADHAASILTSRAGQSDSWGDTVIGAYGDATNLENMKRSFDYIRECNSLRASDRYNSGANKSALMVNDTMMAIAQVQTNASSVKVGHSKLYEVGENLAWGLPNETPFRRWYTDEQRAWKNGGSGKTGHYLNIANPDKEDVRTYATTGYAITDKDGTSYGIAHGQTFSNYRWYSPDSGATNYTVDEYEARFLEYYDKLHGELESAEKEIENLKKQKDALMHKYGNNAAQNIEASNDAETDSEEAA